MKELIVRCIRSAGWPRLEETKIYTAVPTRSKFYYIKELNYSFVRTRFEVVDERESPLRKLTHPEKEGPNMAMLARDIIIPQDDCPKIAKKPLTEADYLQRAIERTLDQSMQPQAMWSFNGFGLV